MRMASARFKLVREIVQLSCVPGMHPLTCNTCEQTSVQASSVFRAYTYMRDARFLDQSTQSVTFELLTYNALLGTFGSWKLTLNRGSSGVYKGKPAFAEIRATVYDGSRDSRRRLRGDCAALAMGLINLAIMLYQLVPEALGLSKVCSRSWREAES